MRIQRYTFQAPVEIPAPSSSQMAGFLDVEPDGELYSIVCRSVEHYPVIVQRSTGARGVLIRAITNQAHDVPDVGKVTLAVQEFIIVPSANFTTYEDWDDEDWMVE